MGEQNNLAAAVTEAGQHRAAVELWRTLRDGAPYLAEPDFEKRVSEDLALFERCRKVIADDDGTCG